VEEALNAYLREGIDVDREGFFLERSVGVYDAVNTLSWLLIADNREVSGSTLAAVRRNLELDLHLLHADGTADAMLSHRQDQGSRQVPVRLIPPYLLYDRMMPNPQFRLAAVELWRSAERPGDPFWLSYALLKRAGMTELSGAAQAASLPVDFARLYPDNGLWRLRRDALSVSAYRHSDRLLSLSYGRATLSSLRIDQTYFGGACGRFTSDELVGGQQGITLRSRGCGRPRRPGYELPLGCEVPHEVWEERLAERPLRQLPPALSELTVLEVANGIELRYATLAGLQGVAAQIALDFEPGGIWETPDTRTKPQAGQVIFLKGAWGEMRYGTDVIRVEGGAFAHGMWHMRETQPPGEAVRVLLTFVTPVDHTFSLVGSSGPDVSVVSSIG
jgi:hypothetical protein